MLVGAASANGCFQPDDTFVNYQRTSTVGVGGAGAGGGVGNRSAREFFEDEVKPGLIANCSGADCHSSGSRAFLLIGQEYASITTYRSSVGVPLIVDPAEDSLLITYPSNAEHPGKSWDTITDLRDATLTWLTLEADNIQPMALLEIGPVTPAGLTVLPLDSLGASFAGFTMSFYAIVYDESVLELTQISVWPPNERGLRMVDPTWVILPPGNGAERVDDSHHGDHVFVAPDRVQLASGQLLVTDWGDGYRLAIRFAELEMLFADELGNTYTPCTRPDLFAAGVDALPIKSQPNQPNGLLYCADQCHGGADGSQPTDVMRLTELLSSPRDDVFACAKVRVFITPTQPNESAIIRVTDPTMAGGEHPFSFGGNSTSHNAFRAAMSEWINKEGAAP